MLKTFTFGSGRTAQAGPTETRSYKIIYSGILKAAENRRIYLIPLVGAGRFERPTPLRPRQFSACPQNALFSTAYGSGRCGQPVEACGTLLNPEAPGSYKIIYS